MSGDHVLVIRRGSRLLRYLEWVYGAQGTGTLTFCVLFWLTAISPVFAGFRLVGLGAKATRLGPRMAARGEAIGDKLAASAQAHPSFTKWLGRAWFVLMVVYALAFITWGLYMAAWWALLVPGNAVCLGLGLYRFRHTKPLRLLATAYRAWKTRTCPQVRIVEDAA